MKTYTEQEIKDILIKHNKWLLWQGGERANLSYANLSYANLSYANLSYANLRSANLSYANLSYANLSYANLSYANLSSANLRYANLSSANLSYAKLIDTLLEGVNWLTWIGITPINGKARAYKIINSQGEGIYQGGINYLKDKQFTVGNINQDVNQDCGTGINLATFQWCLNAKSGKSQRLLLMEFEVDNDNVVCPIASDGKFRVKHCVKVGECDWRGNLKQTQKRDDKGRFTK